jgi:4-amino-4-deoxy-L-arabinose transferase-like glycosyltransferase
MKKFFKENWYYLVGALLVLALFSLRFYRLTILPVFADEAIYIRWAQVMRAEETLRFLPLSDGKQPLFMWAVIPSLKLIDDPLFAGRFVSVLSGFGIMLGVAYLSYLLFKSKKAALAASLIYAVSPFSFFFDRMALVDSMLSMFGVWTFILSYLAIVKKRIDFAMMAGFCLGGAWLTKSPAIFFALMLPTLWLFADWKKGFGGNISVFLKSLSLSLISVLIGYGFYNILRLGPNFSVIASRNMDYVWPLSHLLTSPLDPLKPFVDRSFEWIRMMGPWPIIIMWLFGYLINLKRYWKALLVLTVWFLFPIVVQSEFAKVFTARYILFSIPFLVILAGSVFTEERRNRVWVLVFVLAFFVTQALVFDRRLLTDFEKANLPRSERSGYLEEWTAGQGIKKVADFIRSEYLRKPAEKIVIGTEGYFGTLPDGLQIYLNDLAEITAIGVGLNFDKLPQPLIESRKFGNKTYFVVNKSRFNKDPSKYGLRIIAEYPKAENPDHVRDSLLLMQVI